MKVIKRDGSKVDFDPVKIEQAVLKASVADEPVRDAINDVVAMCQCEYRIGDLSVERIQDMVEIALGHANCTNTLRNYAHYREHRANVRDVNAILSDIYQKQDSSILNENANIDGETNCAKRDFIASEICKQWALTHYLPKEIADAHVRGDIYMHDLGFSPAGGYINCCLVNIKDMLENGFVMGTAHITTPKSIRVATNVVSQIITAVSSQNYGGTTVNRIDEVLAPYVEKTYEKYCKEVEEDYDYATAEDIKNIAMKRTEKECEDAFQQLEYSINCSHNSHAQVPFVTLGFGLGESEWARLIQKWILKTRIKGLGVERKTAIFPKLVFALKRGLNLEPQDPNYDIKQLALECSARRMYPDILSYDKVVEVTGGFKAPMGCRSFLGEWENEKGERVYDGRWNCGVVSVNLPRIALKLKGKTTKERCVEYWYELDRVCELAHKALQVRLKRLKTVQAKQAPICWQYGALLRLQPDDYIYPYIADGRASVSLGYVGVNEAVHQVFNSDDSLIDNAEMAKFAQCIVRFLSERCKEWKQAEGLGYSLYSTPSESLSHTFEKKDRAEFGIVKNVTDKEYYTNSFHLDVRVKTDPFSKIDFESPYPQWASGGFISYVETPNMIHNLQALEQLWDYAYDRVPYFAINSPIDSCTCGFMGESEFKDDKFVCPKCGTSDPQKLHAIRRICGYLGEVNSRPVNKGKLDEFSKRVKHC
jgi:ribonucleoside-triphosphate reductase